MILENVAMRTELRLIFQIFMFRGNGQKVLVNMETFNLLTDVDTHLKLGFEYYKRFWKWFITTSVEIQSSYMPCNVKKGFHDKALCIDRIF